MQGQANHFYRYAPTKIEYGINRYQTETRRLYHVLEDRLAHQEAHSEGLWLVGNKFSIADLACFSWGGCQFPTHHILCPSNLL